MSFKFGTTSAARAQGVNAILMECATRALAKCVIYDQSVQWRGGVRTAQEQNEIFQTGASNKDGFKKKSYHQSGNAIDIAPVGIDLDDLKLMVSGKIAPHPGFQEFAMAMSMAWQEMMYEGKTEGYYLQWGGHWKTFRDLPHWQIVKRK